MAHAVLSRKIHPSQIKLEHGGHLWRHFVLTLRDEQSIAEVRETPDLWTVVQGNFNTKLNRGDRLSIIAPDGLAVADQCPVTRAEGGSVWLGKPLRLIELEETALFSDGKHEVVPNGIGYSVRNLRDGRVDDKVFSSVEAARQEILKRQPVKAA